MSPPDETATPARTTSTDLRELLSNKKNLDISDADRDEVLAKLKAAGWTDLRDMKKGTPEIDHLGLKPGVQAAVKRCLREARAEREEEVQHPFGQAYSGVLGKAGGTVAIMKATYYYTKEDPWAWPLFSLGAVVLLLEFVHGAVLSFVKTGRPFQVTRSILHIGASLCILTMSVYASIMFADGETFVTPSPTPAPLTPAPFP